MRIEPRLAAVRHGLAKASALLVSTLALLLSACEGGVVVAPSGPSASAFASAVISEVTWPEAAPFAGPPVLERGCAGRPYLTPAFDIVITASTTVNLDQVTIRLLDGSSLGGPMITFPQAGLGREFGTTIIAAGQSRPFRFRPRFPCAELPRAIAAELGLVDPSGATHFLTASGPLH